MTGARRDPLRLWTLIDPGAADADVAATLSQLLDLVNSGWTLERPIDIGHPGVHAMLDRHRITTLVPLELVDASQRPWLHARHLDAAATQLRLRSHAASILSALDAADIETRVLKGLATAELDYPDRNRRHTGDVDLAVRPDDLDHTIQLLRTLGYRDQPTPFDPVLLYGWTVETPDGVEVDLHTRLFRRSPLDDGLFADAGEAIGSLSATALRVEHRLVHAAGHFIISPPGRRRMSGVVDITQLLGRGDLDLDEARRFAAAIGVESLVGAGIRVEAELSGRVEVLQALDGWKQPDWLERHTRLVAHRRLVLDHLGRYREVPRGQRLRYVPAWLFPNPDQRQLLRESTSTARGRFIDAARSRMGPS